MVPLPLHPHSSGMNGDLSMCFVCCDVIVLRSRKCKCLCGVDRQPTDLLDIKFKLNLFQVAGRVFMKFKYKRDNPL